MLAGGPLEGGVRVQMGEHYDHESVEIESGYGYEE
jgi:hypothetical protein